MATVPTSIPAVVRGIANLVTNYIVQNEEITDEDVNDPVQDQTGATVGETTYDNKKTLKITLIGPDTAPTTAGVANFSYASAKWKIDTCIKAGTYNDKVKWNVTAHRFTNYPPQA
jgi:hypothetical protein